RITFGGGAPQLWRGTIALSDGRFGDAQLLGLDSDEPGSMALGPRTIQIRQPSPRTYDGLDVDVHAPLDATLRIKLHANDAPAAGRDFQLRLADLTTGIHPSGPDGADRLDETGNRLVVSRAPGDALRVTFERDHLVFSPGETFRFSIVPHALTAEAGASLRLKAEIVSRASGRSLFAQEQDVRLDMEGSAAPWGPWEFVVPEGDAVYDLNISASRRGRFDTLVAANPLAEIKPVAERQVQLVGIGESPTATAPGGEELLDEFDPLTPNWTERVARLPLLKHLPRMQKGHLSAGRSSAIEHLGRKWTQLDPDAWQAHPLSIDAPGAPHVLEVEFPNDLPQTLGVSVIEANAVGDVEPLGVDSAVRVEPLASGQIADIARHRLVFWPRTRTPVVLLIGHDAQRPAVFGRVRVLRLGENLGVDASAAAAPQPRMIAAWFDKPLGPEMFSAAQQADGPTRRSLDDWRTFLESTTRLGKYLRYAGYNTAVMPAIS
ncbi:MAG: hypothetical protein KDA41_20215, partial [Planctomycetales bacterium]|nr:hypothetical protein [Planctomycetales bacterium]